MRTRIFEAIRSRVEPEPWALALWEGGSAAFDRLDAWSDLDVGVGVEDGAVTRAFVAIEEAITAVVPIVDVWVANPDEDIKPQRYYRLAGSDLLVDVGVLPRRVPAHARYVQRSRHGTPKILFDRDAFTADVPETEADMRARLRARLTWLRGRFELLRGLPIKSAARGEAAEAVSFYQAFALRPIVELLRMRHDPWRHDFDVRYLRFDIPEPDRARVYALWFPKDLADMLVKRAEAEAWFRVLYPEIERELAE